jgi:hypothetical protein
MCKKVTFSVLVSASLDVYIESHHIIMIATNAPTFSVAFRWARLQRQYRSAVTSLPVKIVPEALWGTFAVNR